MAHSEENAFKCTVCENNCLGSSVTKNHTRIPTEEK